MKSTDLKQILVGETIEDLGDGFQIIQGKDEFRFGTDAVKLADFANVKPSDHVMDLCTGTGIVPILLYKKVPGVSVFGLEIQEQMVQMATRSVKLNALTEKIRMIHGDLRCIRALFPAESFQVVTCNPPYMKNHTGKQNERKSVTIARHELCCNLEDCIDALRDGESLSEDEYKACRLMFSNIMEFMYDWGIIEDEYDVINDRLYDFFKSIHIEE